MALTVLRGKGDCADFDLLLKAFENPPSLVIDCANTADVHRLCRHIREEQLHEVYVMNAEAIYRLRDTLLQVPYWAGQLRANSIFVTTIGTLFSYDNEEENKEVIGQCREILLSLSKAYDVFVASDGRQSIMG